MSETTVMATAACVKCGTMFSYRRRGRDQVVCGPECKTSRVRRQTAARVDRWALRRAQAAVARGTGLV